MDLKGTSQRIAHIRNTDVILE